MKDNKGVTGCCKVRTGPYSQSLLPVVSPRAELEANPAARNRSEQLALAPSFVMQTTAAKSAARGKRPSFKLADPHHSLTCLDS